MVKILLGNFFPAEYIDMLYQYPISNKYFQVHEFTITIVS